MTPEELMNAYLDDFRRKYAGKRVQKTPTSLFAFALSNWSGRTPEDVARETAWLLDSFATYCGKRGRRHVASGRALDLQLPREPNQEARE